MVLLNISSGITEPGVFTEPFREALREFGELRLVENGAAMAEEARAALIRQCDVLLTCWGSSPVPVAVARECGRLRYVCNVTGTLRHWIPIEIIEAGIPVTNWGDAPADEIAEGAMALLLATLKDLHRQVMAVRRGEWALDQSTSGGTLEGRNVGIYGCGHIGRRFVEMIRPFGAVLRVFDPYAADVPEGCTGVASLDELFDASEIIVIHAGLSDETRGSVTAELLARLPRHGVIINTARGGIIAQDALFAELESGRLRAGLDVLEPDVLPEDHPARTWENVILTGHNVGRGWPTGDEPSRGLQKMHRISLDNLRRLRDGEPLRFAMDCDRYLRST